jgi:hypothetical protein
MSWNDRVSPMGAASKQRLAGTGVNTLTIPSGANYCTITPEVDCRFTTDGSTPTGAAGGGTLIKANTIIIAPGSSWMAAFKVIAVSGSLEGIVDYGIQAGR